MCLGLRFALFCSLDSAWTLHLNLALILELVSHPCGTVWRMRIHPLYVFQTDFVSVTMIQISPPHGTPKDKFYVYNMLDCLLSKDHVSLCCLRRGSFALAKGGFDLSAAVHERFDVILCDGCSPLHRDVSRTLALRNDGRGRTSWKSFTKSCRIFMHFPLSSPVSRRPARYSYIPPFAQL